MGQRHNVFAGLTAALLLAGLGTAFSEERPARPLELELWYWHRSDPTSEAGVAKSKALIDEAAKDGYTGVAFWDQSFAYLSDKSWPEANRKRLQTVIEYAARTGLQVMAQGAPFGWSNPALLSNGNMAEGQRVIGTPFRVAANGKRLRVVNGLTPLGNGGFEEGRREWFDTGDNGIGTSASAHSGKQAAVIVDAQGNARLRQKVTLTPWRQYHLSFWVKAKDFRGPAIVEVLDWWHRSVNRFYAELETRGTADWKRVDYAFDSQDTRWAYLYLGVWGGSQGVIWLDDVQLEETGPVYVVRREGAPVRLYNPNHPEPGFAEGRDYDRIEDPAFSGPRARLRDVFHAPVEITLPRGTRLLPGQTVALDYYAAFPLPKDQQLSMCLTTPAVFDWLEKNARACRAVLPARSAVLLGYDELRQANSCGSCREKKMTAGELLAWNVQRVVKLYQRTMPGAPLYIWSDMFDPSHNAHDHYYYVEGDLAGSWKGLPDGVTILNWNHPKLKQSLAWFAGNDGAQPKHHEQIIAGYYDSGRGESASDDFRTASGIPGIRGIMYVTWRDDYSQMKSFAAAARRGWAEYLRSLGKQPAN